MIHITCKMGRRDLPDMYALSPRLWAYHAIKLNYYNIENEIVLKMWSLNYYNIK